MRTRALAACWILAIAACSGKKANETADAVVAVDAAGEGELVGQDATDAGAEAGADAGADVDAGTVADADADTGTDALTATDADIGADAATATDAATGTDADTGTDAATATDADGDTAANPACGSCDDGNVCTTDACAAGVCSHQWLAGCVNALPPCDAGHPCAKGVCDPALLACVPCVVSTDCGPAYLCQAHACKPAVSCASDKGCKDNGQVCAKSDGVCVECNVAGDCSGQQACVDHACLAAAPCKSSKECTGVCDVPAGLCVDCLASEDCNNGFVCSAIHLCVPPICKAGVCASGVLFACQAGGGGYASAVDCQDSNPCTTDGCDTTSGCVHLPAPGTCSDADACTTGDACAGGACSGKASDCSDGNACTADACDAKLGCTHAPGLGPCSDGNACTDGDACQNGACQGAAKNCDDGNLCTQDSCAGPGCVNVAASEGIVCGAGLTCQAGACKASAGDPCAGTSKLFEKIYGGANATLSTTLPWAGGFLAGGSPNAWLLSVDTAGGQIWEKYLSKTEGDSVHALLPLGTGHAAALVSHDDGASTTNFWHDIDANGAVVSSVTFDGGNLSATGNAAIAVADGFLIAGSANAAPSVASGWLIHLGADGKPGWSKTYAGSPYDMFSAIAKTSGGYAAVGKRILAGKNYAWLVLTDATGTQTASLPWGAGTGAAGDQFNAVLSLEDSSLLLAGSHNTVAGLVAWFVRADAAGKSLWSLDVGDSQFSTSAQSVSIASDGSFLGAGVMSGPPWLARVQANGTLLFAKVLVNNSYGSMYDVRALTDGSLLLAGHKNTANTVGGGRILHSDAWGHVSCGDAGSCAKTPTCNDGNPCTADSCNPTTGCGSTPVAGPCSDGDACTDGDACANGKCEPSKVTFCDDSNVCTSDSCNAKSGCVFAANTSTCDDANPCTNADSCQGGACKGAVVDCNDNNACTVDTCNGTSCVHTSAANGLKCGSGLVCASGACLPGLSDPCANGELFSIALGNQSTSIQRVLPVAGGGFLVNTDALQSTLVRLDAQGKVLWQKNLAPAGAISDIAALGSGHFAVSITAAKQPASPWQLAHWLEIDAAGAVLKATVHDSGAEGTTVDSLLPMADGSFVLVGSAVTGTGSKGWAARLDASGKELWNKTYGTDYENFRSASERLDGGILFAGRTIVDGKWYGWTVTTDGAGNVTASKTYGPGTSNGGTSFTSCTVTADGGSVVTGERKDSTGLSKAWLLRLNSGGLIVWERTFSQSVNYTSRFEKVRLVPGGDFIVSGSDQAYGTIARYGAAGNLRWYSTFGNEGFGSGKDVDVLDNGFVLAGSKQNSLQNGRVTRLDAWGNYDCKDAGTCPSQAQSACQKGNPCLMDACDGIASCASPAAPDGILCADGKTCQGGLCK